MSDDVDAQLKRLIHEHLILRRDLAEYLLEFDRRKLWWKMGYSSLYNYCENKLKLCPDDVDEILATTSN